VGRVRLGLDEVLDDSAKPRQVRPAPALRLQPSAGDEHRGDGPEQTWVVRDPVERRRAEHGIHQPAKRDRLQVGAEVENPLPEARKVRSGLGEHGLRPIDGDH